MATCPNEHTQQRVDATAIRIGEMEIEIRFRLRAKMNGCMIDVGKCLQQTVKGIAHLASCWSKAHSNGMQPQQYECTSTKMQVNAVVARRELSLVNFVRLAAGHCIC